MKNSNTSYTKDPVQELLDSAEETTPPKADKDQKEKGKTDKYRKKKTKADKDQKEKSREKKAPVKTKRIATGILAQEAEVALGKCSKLMEDLEKHEDALVGGKKNCTAYITKLVNLLDARDKASRAFSEELFKTKTAVQKMVENYNLNQGQKK